ncbi:MAG: helix-turn-helix domain-containing protein [Gemmatimonadales bacterium]
MPYPFARRPAVPRSGRARLPMSLDVRDLRLVSAVAEHGRLTRAAEVLHSVQSSLSHHLADLEERVGSPLFVRAATAAWSAARCSWTSWSRSRRPATAGASSAA